MSGISSKYYRAWNVCQAKNIVNSSSPPPECSFYQFRGNCMTSCDACIYYATPASIMAPIIPTLLWGWPGQRFWAKSFTKWMARSGL